MTKGHFKFERDYIIKEKLEKDFKDALVRSILLLAEVTNELTSSYRKDKTKKEIKTRPFEV